MRFHLKRTLQIGVICACVLLYINFFLVSKPSFNIDLVVGQSGRSLPLDVKDVQKETTPLKTNLKFDGNLVTGKDSYQNATKEDHFIYFKKQVYPSEEYDKDDRILSQLEFIPMSVQKAEASKQEIPLKKILLYGGIGHWALKGQSTFLDQKCKVPHCTITESKADMLDADVVMFQSLPRVGLPKAPNQIWLLFMLESPYHTPGLGAAKDMVNWTATYRHDSTIVAPYEKFVPYNFSVLTKPQEKNYAEGKTKKVAWFVSNCAARNGRRQYVDELAKFIEVDIYGHCGTKKCPRHQSSKCFDMLNKDYKFYLSFENSNCRDYITEKFFVNGLKHDVIPIVMGAAPEDYRRAAPPHSFIHVDDFESPKELAEYLLKLDSNDQLYNEYFRWKGTGDIINTFYWCRVCALAHDVENRGHSWYEDIDKWWRGPEVCIGQSNWRQKPVIEKLIGELPKLEPNA